MDATGVVPSTPGLKDAAAAKKVALVPVPPSEPKALAPPAKMAMVTLLPLNSFAVTVNWTPPADVFSRKSRSALAIARGKSITGNLTGETSPDLPVAGYRLRYWSIVSQEDCRYVQMHHDIGLACREVTGKGPELLDDIWGPDSSSAVLKWLIPGNTYVFQVMAFNVSGEGDWSEASRPFIMPERPDGLGMEFEEEEEQVPEPPDEGVDPRLASMKGRPAHLSKSIDAIEIAWDKPCDRGSEIETYEFMISRDPKFPKLETRQMSVDGQSEKLQLDGLIPNQVYYVKHRAHNLKGASAWSETTLGIATRARPPEKPDPPVRVGDAESLKPGEVIIKWEHPESFNIPVQHYRVRSSLSQDMSEPVEVLTGFAQKSGQGHKGELMETEGQGPPQILIGGQKRFARGSFALTQMKIRGLRPSTTYYFQVQASNQIGCSDWSDASSPMKMGSCAPEKCRKPQFIAGSVKEGMRIYWPVPDTFGEGPVTRYDVRLSQNAMMKGDFRLVEDIKVKSADVTALPNETLVEALVPGVWGPLIDQFFQVRAYSTAGVGPWSSSSDAMQVRSERPSKPEAPYKFELLPRTIVAFWRPSDSLGRDIIGFGLRYSESRSMSCSCEVEGIKGTNTNFAVSNLQPSKSYYFQVRCINAIGTSDWSDPSAPVKVKQDVPSKMAPPELIASSANSVSVSFTKPADMGTFDGDLVDSYSMIYACGPQCEQILHKYSEAEDSGDVKVITDVRPTSTTIDGLRPGDDVAIQVFATNDSGDGPPSNIAVYRTHASRPEAPNPPLTSSTADETTSWSTFVGVKPKYDGGRPVTSFGFEFQELRTGQTTPTPVWRTNPPDEKGVYYFCINQLRPGNTYQFRAYAVNDQGDSDWSDWSEAMTTQPFAPSPPTVPPVLQDPDASSFLATWDEIDGNGAPVTGWVVQWSVDYTFTAPKSIREAVTKEREHRCGHCLPGVNMYARVAGMNSEGRSHFGPIASVKTLFDKPVQCAPPRVTSATATELRLAWMHPHNGGSELTGFWLRWWETEGSGREECVRDCGEMLIKGKRRFVLVDNLRPKTFYQFQLAAENSTGLGQWSEPCRPSRTADASPPTAPGKPVCIRSSLNTITLTWSASESIGVDCTAQVVQISNRPDFPPSLTGQAWLPPYREGGRKGISAEVAFRTPQAFNVGPEKRPGFPDGKTAKVNPRRHSISYGRVTLSRSAWTPTPGLLKDLGSQPTGRDELETAAWQKQVFESIFTAETAAHIASAAVQSFVKEQIEVLGLSDTSTQPSKFALFQEEIKKTLTKEKLEEKKLTARRGIFIEPGFKGLMQQLKDKQKEDLPPPPPPNKYTLIGMQPGTFYYARVATVNEVGISDWSPISLPCASGAYPPAEIPQEPGIELLRVGCTSLSFGWKRPYCGGAPVTHYMVRFSQSAEELWSDDCYEFQLEETEVETWHGIVHDEAAASQLQKPDLVNEEVVSSFAEYLITRFGGVEESWEWLDINGNGEIGRDEFIKGDIDTGPPFIDFPRPEWLEQVWDLLDSDGTKSISINEYNKLRPYMEAVQRGQSGTRYDGFYCMVPSLIPGKSYYIMARSCNRMGMADWTQCLKSEIKTMATTPPRMEPVESIIEHRSAQSIALRWKIPWGNGDVIRRIEVKWHFQDIEDGNVLYDTLIRDGTLEVFEQDPATGEIKTEMHLPKLQPGQIVAAVARPFNGIGGARLWSPMPGPGQGNREELWTWDLCTHATEADIPHVVYMLEDTMQSKNALSFGKFQFEIGARTNGRHILRFDFLVLDEQSKVVQEFSTDVPIEESTRLRKEKDKTVQGNFEGLLPGELYSMKARVINAVGPSQWSPDAALVRMPADVPNEPGPLSSELTSLEFIEVKWKPPIENGAEIEKYELRLALRPDAIEEEWILIDPDDLKANTKVQGSDLKRLTHKDQGSYAFRVHGLRDGTTYFFTHRACNRVGCSAWSEVTKFSTKNSKPAQLTDLWEESDSTTSREVTIAWNPPETNGVELMRYDVVGGPNERVIRWCQFTSLLMDATVDVDKLYGYAIKDDAEEDVPLGNDNFAELYCEESMYTPVMVPKTRLTLSNLLPGQDYFFIARAVAISGKGEFSKVLGPCRTAPEAPQLAERMQLQTLDHSSCSACFRLPFDFGAPIDGIHASLKRVAGPLSLDELDENGEAQAHVAGQEIRASQSDLSCTEPPGEPEGEIKIIHAGVTAALRRAFEAEGLPKALPAKRLETTSTAESCTGRAYQVRFDDLRPGTKYEISWACHNAVGQSPFSSPLQVETISAQPDQPPPIAVASL